MLEEDDLLQSGFLESNASKFFIDTAPTHPSLSSPFYTSDFGVEADPWGSGASFDPIVDMRQDLTVHNAVDDDILGSGLTAASVLVGIDLPEIYDTAYIRAGPVNDRVTLESLKRVIGLSGLPSRTVEEILNIISPADTPYIIRNEFNTALALVACAQKNMDISLSTVYQHRKELPIPMLSNLDTFHIKRNNQTMKPMSNPPDTRAVDDPWRLTTTVDPRPNGFLNLANEKKGQDDSHLKPRNHALTDKLNSHANGLPRAHSDGGFSSATTVTHVDPSITPKDMLAEPAPGFMSDTPKPSAAQNMRTCTESHRWFSDLDYIKVAVAPEKEGFIFKHVNYILESQLRSSIVLRRYSDFFWLWEILLKRYPFRIVPNLPPKKISGKDAMFMDRRCKGLTRFINGVIRHPVLKNDDVVKTFLTEPSEFQAWRRANHPVTDEEFIRMNSNTEEIETCIPPDINERIQTIRNQLPIIIQHYEKQCNIVERMTALRTAYGSEYTNYSTVLHSMGEVEQKCYIVGCSACQHVVRGYKAVAEHMERATSIVENESTAVANGILENLRYHRDIFIGFAELLERKSRLAANQINTLSKKLAGNKIKVNQNRGVPGLEAEVERLDVMIQSDFERLSFQQRRDTHIKFCIASELSYLHKHQALVSWMYQKFVHEQLQFARQTVDNWKALEVFTSDTPETTDFA
ncbi:uncharacterized protein BYT42DRAFT_617150 [Radiomyces spectabilis]|uniref:uncharacterized protein n=1 Tax=Radiomyces spectabilis TaxID=64574 RepID=UPI00221FC212|nr:uncharacterized protein BYT42DRAFT_617150 [Radiomyces spectabilis]KAI8370613.1 hypothetical protein BYT42DRAFT_617150 [Radiomyces spectabilis]